MQYTPDRNSLPIGTQSFEVLRSENSVYVDKTEHIYKLITGGRVYFLSRPRRFGKSLLISTLEALFKGQRKLFKDTWIDSAEYDWAGYPVIRLDMIDINNHDDIDAFKAALKRRMAEIANHYDVNDLPLELDETTCFSYLIKALAKINRVVVLVDEYDKPMLENILDEPRAEAMRNTLRKLYGIVKAQDENLRFVMLTGITKFSKVSVFSGLNNLKDITMTNRFAAICGYTQVELENTFAPWIENLAKEQQTTEAEQLLKIKLWYNGYQFSKGGAPVYNPFSTLNLFDDLEYEPYWYGTGTPNFLIELINAQQFSLNSLNRLAVDALDLEIHDMPHMDIIPLLYQTGYLTIKAYDSETQRYTLAYPNHEVDSAFSRALFMHFSEASADARISLIDGLVDTIKAGQYDEMFKAMQTFFSGVPYHLHDPSEKYYHNLFYLVFHLVGLKIGAEVATNIGRMDAMIELGNQILIFELKVDQTSQVALQQIHDKRYYEPYRNQGKQILLFGVNISKTEKNITDWQLEELSE